MIPIEVAALKGRNNPPWCDPVPPLQGLNPFTSIKPRAALRSSRRYALPWADLSLPLRGVSEVVPQSPDGRREYTESVTSTGTCHVPHAPKGQPQISPGQSDQRERRPG